MTGCPERNMPFPVEGEGGRAGRRVHAVSRRPSVHELLTAKIRVRFPLYVTDQTRYSVERVSSVRRTAAVNRTRIRSKLARDGENNF